MTSSYPTFHRVSNVSNGLVTSGDGYVVVDAVVSSSSAVDSDDVILPAGALDLAAWPPEAIPVLSDHRREAASVLGHVESVTVDGDKVRARLRIVDPHYVERIKAGGRFNVSAGFKVERS